jgi:hypothetical protein
MEVLYSKYSGYLLAETKLKDKNYISYRICSYFKNIFIFLGSMSVWIIPRPKPV